MPIEPQRRRGALPSPSTRRALLTAGTFLAVPLAGLLIFRVGTVGQALVNSLYQYNLLSGTRVFVGVGNYVRAAQDAGFLLSLLVTCQYAVMKIGVQLPLALGIALLMQKSWRWAGVVRTAVYLPVVTPFVVVATLWALMYNPTIGIIAALLRTARVPPLNFLVDPRLALPSLTAVTIWKDLGFSALIFLAGLQGIPQGYYEAAQVDGAGPWRQFWNVTLPLLKRFTLFALVIATINAFQVYTPVYVMTQGGPLDRTKVATYYMYERAFLFYQMGYASALAIIVLLMILGLSALYFRLLRTE